MAIEYGINWENFMDIFGNVLSVFGSVWLFLIVFGLIFLFYSLKYDIPTEIMVGFLITWFLAGSIWMLAPAWRWFGIVLAIIIGVLVAYRPLIQAFNN